jgi:hypothetical protein
VSHHIFGNRGIADSAAETTFASPKHRDRLVLVDTWPSGQPSAAARAKWLHRSGTVNTAALQSGGVTDVARHDAELASGYERAGMFTAKPGLYGRLQEQTLSERMRRRIVEGPAHRHSRYATAIEGTTTASLGRS